MTNFVSLLHSFYCFFCTILLNKGYLFLKVKSSLGIFPFHKILFIFWKKSYLDYLNVLLHSFKCTAQ